MYCTLYRRQWAMILHCPGVKTPIAISVVIMRPCSSKVIRVMLGMILWRWSLFVAIVTISGWLELNGICGTGDARVWVLLAQKHERENHLDREGTMGRRRQTVAGCQWKFWEGHLSSVGNRFAVCRECYKCASSGHSASSSTCRVGLLHNSSSSNKSLL